MHRDTVCLSVVDRDRMAVSMIYSIYHAFGSGIATDRFGILLQNRGAGFTLAPGHPNEAAGGRRPLHTIIPAMLREGGRMAAAFGVMGGAYQPVGHVRVVQNMARYGMDPQEAIDAPRAFADGPVLMLERGHPDDVAAELATLGHDVRVPETPLGGAQMVAIDEAEGTLTGASDPRKDGCALGV
jgi:gamma-glutamyltranspeptidase/glutathione hydrolase